MSAGQRRRAERRPGGDCAHFREAARVAVTLRRPQRPGSRMTCGWLRAGQRWRRRSAGESVVGVDAACVVVFVVVVVVVVLGEIQRQRTSDWRGFGRPAEEAVLLSGERSPSEAAPVQPPHTAPVQQPQYSPSTAAPVKQPQYSSLCEAAPVQQPQYSPSTAAPVKQPQYSSLCEAAPVQQPQYSRPSAAAPVSAAPVQQQQPVTSLGSDVANLIRRWVGGAGSLMVKGGMASDEREDIPDLRLGGECEETLETAGPNTQLSSPRVAAQTLSLSRGKLNEITESILRNGALKNLYLEGNQILKLPDSMFASLPNLVWLDLRNNLIGSLPAGIGSHRCLNTLLLEGNPISALPPELGNVLTLKGLNLRNCPIRSPPQDIMHQGLERILQYLRSAMAERPASVQRSHPEVPPVEKLRLSELVKSSVDSCGDEEEEEDEPELQRFRELKDKMILLDRAELDHGSARTTRPHGSLPVVKRSEKSKTAAMEGLKEKQDILEQRKKDQELLQKWRTNAKAMQEQKAVRLEQERRENQLRAVTRGAAPNSTQWQQRASGSPKEQDEARAARDRDLEQRIRKQVQMMQERRRKPTGTAEEEVATAEQDMRETMKLQAELLGRKQDRGKEYRLTAFTGDILPAYPNN
ncbi:Leucine-rich repeat-containing protein 27 [Merluccius polli]|uniref:Leucine-rich repeat-containing protein 27 n=1 Tax=Merluccius polli TaxID=89951 RepID=A0AA47NLS8_MERPO|nr:Leucine-rich repeat-containing protein 27 [Merluccius polli]